MSLRILQVVLPRDQRAALGEVLCEVEPDRVWTVEVAESYQVTNVLTRADQCEALMDALADRFDGTERFRVSLLPVEATRPKLPEPKEPEPEADAPADDRQRKIKPLIGRVSREELEEDLAHNGHITRLFLAMTSLATVVACIGLLQNSAAIIIGAMVIAPLLGPNMSLALGTTLGDLPLIRKSLLANAAGVATALAIAALFGLVTKVDPESAQLAARASVGYMDIPLALAAGAAGALASTTGAPAVLVGVMVAVALLPPTAACGLLAGAGSWKGAGMALVMVMINVVGINLAATGVFLLQGIRPATWWDKDRARIATVRALLVWGALMATLLGLIALTR